MNDMPWIYLVIAIAIFIICRELVCWYFKQTEQVVLLKEIKNLLERQSGLINSPEKKILTGGKKCWSCGAEHPSSVKICPDCGNNLK